MQKSNTRFPGGYGNNSSFDEQDARAEVRGAELCAQVAGLEWTHGYYDENALDAGHGRKEPWTGTLNFEQFKLWMGKHEAENEPNEFMQNNGHNFEVSGFSFVTEPCMVDKDMDKYDKENGPPSPTMVCRILWTRSSSYHALQCS